MSSSTPLISPLQPPDGIKMSLRRRLAGWAGIEDRPPVAQESWWLPDDRSSRSRHNHNRHGGSRGDSSDTASVSSRGRCDSDSAHGDGPDQQPEQRRPSPTRRRSRKRDWFKVLLAARNLATCVYAVSYTTTLPVLPFMANKLIYPQESQGPDDPGSEGVREVWRGLAYGLVMSGYYFTKMIAAPWIGFLSDRVGRRQALVVTLLGGALSFLLTKLWGQYSIHGLILCRLFMGCFAANGALMHAYIRDTVPQEWQSSAFSQHSASWGCAYLAAPALLAWAGDSADAILTVATATMVISAVIVEITFVDTRPEGSRTQRMSSVVGEYLIEGARDLAEVGKKFSGLDLADYFNAGKEREPSPLPEPAPGGSNVIGGDLGSGNVGALRRSESVGINGLRHRHSVGAMSRTGHANGNGFSGTAGREGGSGTLDPRPYVGDDGGGGGGVSDKGKGEDEEGLSRAGVLAMWRALVAVFEGMMKERLVLVTFVLQAIRPAQDLAPLVALKFSGGASVLAGITSSRSLCRVLVPMTPLISWLVRLAGGSSGAGAAGRMSGDRAVAAFMCVLMAGLVVCVPAVGTLRELHHLMAFKGLCYIVRASTAGAVMARVARPASVGAFFGWQHCIKGLQGTLSHFLTGWLSGYSISAPYYMVAVCDLLYAFTYLYI